LRKDRAERRVFLFMKTATLFALFFVTFSLPARAAVGVIAGPVTNAANNHIYYLLDAAHWTNAEVAAVELGGHLATINDATEDAWVYSTFSSFGGQPRVLWIGLNDAASEGTFVWVSGEVSAYTHWAPGEPNNLGNEDFVCYFPPNHQSPGSWNDCTWSAECNGIVEIVPLNTTNCVPTPSGLLSWWTANGTGNDLVGPNHGTPVGGVAFADGRYGQAFDFDGINDGVNVADSPSLQLTQSLTIEGWVYIKAWPYEPQNFWGVAAIVFRADDRAGLDPYHLMVRGPTRMLEFTITTANGESAMLVAPVSTGQWFHVAATLDDASSAMKIYLNGSIAAQTNTSFRPLGPLEPAANSGLGIGNVQGAGRSQFRFPFNGLIDNLRFYSRALTVEEIQSIYNPPASCEAMLDLRLYAGITVSAPIGSTVRIDDREALSPPDAWQPLTNILIPSSPYLFFDASSSAAHRRFYRAFVAP
jgi:hypothetical protein